MGGPDVRVRVIRVVKGGCRAGAATLRFTPRAALGMQQVMGCQDKSKQGQLPPGAAVKTSG